MGINNLETSSLVYGVYTPRIDPKKRISLPSEWREAFPPNMSVSLLNSGSHAILLPTHAIPEDLSDEVIRINKVIDTTGRILLGENIREAFMTNLGDIVWLVGKGRYIEVHFNAASYQSAISKSKTAIQRFKEQVSQNL